MDGNIHLMPTFNQPLHDGTRAEISVTFRISLTSTDLGETYHTWFRIVQRPRICNYFFSSIMYVVRAT